MNKLKKYTIIGEIGCKKGKKGMKAYKLLRIKKGNLYPLFINKTQCTPIGVWLDAELHPTKGFAIRKGWHCCFNPIAPHLKTKLANGEQRVWVECEVEDWESYDRPESQGGSWILAQRMKVTRVLYNSEVQELQMKFYASKIMVA